MSYFKNFPYVEYPFPDSVRRMVKDISRRPTLTDGVREESQNLEQYLIKDKETPETIAWDKYGDVNLHWIIMLSNDIMNIYKDWPKSSSEFEDYIYYKYRFQKGDNDSDVELTRTETLEYTQYAGTPEDLYSSKITRSDDPTFSVTIRPAFFEGDVDGELVSYDTQFADEDAFGRQLVQEDLVPVSYWVWEERLNEQKREIWIPTVDVAKRMHKQLKDLMNE